MCCVYLSLSYSLDLRMSGVYWSVTALSLLRPHDAVMQAMRVYSQQQQQQSSSTDSESKKLSILDWVFACFDKATGGFAGNSGGQDGHLLYTLSAIQILALADRLHDPRLQRERVIQFCVSLQQPDGSFAGDAWGEIDTRFTYCALSTLSLLGALERVDVTQAAHYIMACRNLDGGFGCVIGAESHAGTCRG